MVTLKLKPKSPARPGTPAPSRADRGPLRGSGSAPRTRPTLAQAQAERARRDEAQQMVPPRPPREPARDEPPRQQRDEAPRQARDQAAKPFRGQARDQPRDQPRDDRPRPAPQQARPPARTPVQPPERPGGPVHNPSRNPKQADRSRQPAFNRRDDDDDDDLPLRESEPGSLRLSKRMSQLGMASRREADEWIAQGWVRVDDHVVSELGSRVMPGQRITIDARAKFQQAQRVTVLINKPVGYVSGQAEDGYEPALVLVTPANQWRDDPSGTRFLREHLRSLVPAGRLDIDSVGLLVLTQDGRIAKQLIGEDSDVEKEYLVRVATADGSRLRDEGLQKLRHGIELDGEALREAVVEWVNDDQLRFVLKEGKKRQIRRMCEAVGLRVLGLKRVRIGKVMLGDLPAGQWRYLRADEAFG